MTHIELIEFIYKHRKVLDDVYKGKVNSVSEMLERSRLIMRVGDSIELSSNYRNFVDITLSRIDYGIIFHTYSGQLQDLLKYKQRYLVEEKSHYLDDIMELIRNIFIKLQQRDEEIRLLLIKIENENSLDLDILLEKSMDILDKITEVNRANNEIRQMYYDQIYGLDIEIDHFIDEINPQMIRFISNISTGLDRLNQFIARTRRLRLQNKMLFQLSINILEEKDEKVDEFLSLEPNSHYLTIHRSQRNRVETFPDGSETLGVVRKLRKIINDIEIKKENRKVTLQPIVEENLSLVNLSQIEQDLTSDGTDDIFMFIYQHNQLKPFTIEENQRKEESFKIFLQLIIPENRYIQLTNSYNKQEILIAKWVSVKSA